MRALYRLLIGLVLVLSLGCGGSRSGGETVTITFWHSFVSTTRPALAELIRRFEADHPDIRIRAQYIPTGDGLIQKLMSSIQSGTAPDISWVHADFLSKLVLADAIYPMEPIVRGPNGLTEAEFDDIYPGLIQAARWRDTLYAMPMEATLLALIYNRDHFRQVGLDPNRPPATWEELQDHTRRLTRDTDGDGRIDHFGFYVPVFPASGPLNIWMVLQWSPYLWMAGGHEIESDQSRVLYDSDAGVRALTLWRDIYRGMGSPSFSFTHDVSFASQQVSMIMDGPWDLPRFKEMEGIDWAIAPLPAGPEGQATYLAGEHLAIFRQSKHPDAAWTFIRWVLRPETQAFFSAASGYLPVTKSTLDLPEYRQALERDPALRAFVEQMPLGRPRRPIDLFHVEINRHIAEAIERSLVGRQDPRAALRESADRSNQLLRSTATR